MTYLLADVGGTNSRLALGDPSGLRAGTLARFRNDDFTGFEPLVSRYLEMQGRPGIDAACIAVAGPVGNGEARLTNRHWTFHRDRLGAVTGARRVLLVNDLAMLACAVPHVQPQPVHVPDLAAPDGQFLVAGIGTGFNVSLARRDGDGLTVMAAEAGHASLPGSVLSRLAASLGETRGSFRSIESCFSGRGLERLFHRVSGRQMDAREILRRASSADPAVERAVTLFASALGDLSRDLSALYLPRGGLVFAGSVSVGILNCGTAREAFLKVFLDDADHLPPPHEIAVSLVTEDAAALWGCLRHVRETLAD